MPDIASVIIEHLKEPEIRIATLTDLCDLIESGSEEEKRRLAFLVYELSQVPCGIPLVGRPEEHECER